MAKAPSYYATLGIPIDATSEEIRNAYRSAARKLHPDMNASARATEFLNIQEAYEILSNPNERSEYNKNLPSKNEFPPPVDIRTIYSRSALPMSPENQLIYVLLDMEISKENSKGKNGHQPLNVCLVLDSSTSMQGNRMGVVQATAIEIVKKLKPNDILSIITFNDRAEILLSSSYRPPNIQIEARIRNLLTKGGTEIYQGLKTAFTEVTTHLGSQFIKHLVLITDGHTYGDEDKCLHLAEQSAQLGIGISGLGIGSKWNDAFLDKLASITGGESMYIANPKDTRKALMNKIQGLSDGFIDRVTLNLPQVPDTKMLYAFRFKPEAGILPTQSPIRLGRVPNDSSQLVLFEFLVNPILKKDDGFILSRGNITFDVPSYTVPTYKLPLNFVRPVTETTQPEPPPQAIVQAMSQLTLYRMQEEAKKDLQSGKVEQASRRLKYLATNLLSQDKHDLAKTVLIEVKNIQEKQALSDDGNKRIKYGTRALPTHFNTLGGNIQ